MGVVISETCNSSECFSTHIACLVLGAVFAVIDEIYQSTVIGRFSSSFDVIADFIGLTLAILSNKIFTKKLS